ncbi:MULTISPECIES: hypothetical protein [Pseudomonas]|jgi:hypothetical protein|uniref:Uncharacterized protein n=2 Tax=Pseudomonas TaxID=286 RepID=A0A370XQA5_PSEFL|nr:MULTISPECIES: hypothetical protein [Pseudomonas]MBY8958392.1 hypothetical protein [Pseudomonas sp. MIS38]NMZ89906.1 hypothetical protein [Pseudomonas marginalis]QBX42367.1 hypothetical protein E4T63_17970 [Pseudomonas fluorescens]RDS90470.1 hypothetical protein DL347_13730 [Pseudomonas fluorescens]RRW68290.1 hypothetical protein EGJ53_00615 [Pseudomonas fluorescens]
MTVQLKKEHLQTAKYTYTWKRDNGDGRYAGPKDRSRVDKDEGYEVLEFIENLMNKHSKKTLGDVHNAENALHAKELSAVVMRDDLNAKVKKALGW